MHLYELDPRSAARLRRPDLARVIHEVDGRALITEKTRAELPGRVLDGRRPRAHTVDPARWAEAGERLILAWSAATCAPLPDSVRDEAQLLLYARPELRLEYMGRGKIARRARSVDKVTYLDIAGGRRHYAFREIVGADGAFDERIARVAETYAGFARWLDDPEARLVLSLGGGGFRLFAAQAAVRALERLLDHRRDRIDEVWGSSGGALLGYAFAHGHDLSVVEELGYLLYHGRTREIPGLDIHTALAIARRAVRRDDGERRLRPEMSSWVDSIDRMCPPEARRPSRVPFFALASNTRWNHGLALAEPRYIPEYCRDFLLPCAANEATGASMAVPFLVSPMRGMVSGFERDRWFDGSIAEENPIMLPFAKWMRDRKHDPDNTPRRLKLVLVNLNMRFGESQTLARMPAPLAAGARQVTNLIDLMLDSKTTALIRTLRELDDVEIMTATLELGQMKFIARAAIPELIRTGQVVDGWRFELHGAGI